MKISVITPSYNSGKYLERAIKSVLKQDYNNWEHIVVDGGSTDDTVEILKKYPHVIWKSEKDHGQSDAMNKGFNLSSGDIIVYLNADDYFEEHIFQIIIQQFQDNAIDAVIGSGKIVDVDRTISTWVPEHSYWKIILHYQFVFPYNPCTYFYRRNVQIKIGGFNVANHYTMDYEFLLHLYKHFRIKYIPTILGNFFFDGTNKTATVNSKELCRQTALSFLKENDLRGYILYKSFPYYILFRNTLKKLFHNV